MKKKQSSLTQKAMQALTESVAKVIEDHRRRGKPLAVWRNGRAVWVNAADLGTMHERPVPYRVKGRPSKS